jgi:acetyl esterase/lipase
MNNIIRALIMLNLLTATGSYGDEKAACADTGYSTNEILIWGNDIPGPKIEGIAERIEYRKSPDIPLNRALFSVSVPRMEIFVPEQENRSKTAVLICPGGGYLGIMIDKEGYNVAEWLNSIGITAFVLKYRLNEYGYPWIICDVQQAIRVIRQRADEFDIAADKIGIMGFSAGGHLAASASVHWQRDFLKDAAAEDNLRPDFSILAYPVISFQPGLEHKGSRINLLGDKPKPELVDLFSNELHIDEKTPPAFLFHATDDKSVPVANSVEYYNALVKQEINAEMHLFSHGGHGFAMAKKDPTLSIWMQMCENWLKQSGLLEPKE